jgi:hypothetical protein
VDKKKPDSVTFVKEKFEEGTHWPTIRQVQINRSFYSGYQWISWNGVQKRLFVPDLRPGEKRYTYNKIKPAVKTLLAKVCKNRIKLEVKPDTNDVERIEVAKAGFKYLGYQWDVDEMDRKSRQLKFYMIVDGFPALKVYIDKAQGDDIPEPAEVPEEMEGVKLPTKTGKIITQVVDQMSLRVDLSAESLEEIRWACEGRPMDVDEIEDIWGKKVNAEDNISMRQTLDVGLSMDQSKRYKNMAMVYDYWEFPCPKYPNGRRIVVAGDQELEKSDDPGENPFIFFPADPIPGSAVASGLVTDMTTPQKSYNIKRTAEARILEEMGNPMWLNPTNDDEELVNEIGGIVHYQPNETLKPERVPGIEPGAGWQNAMERDEADLEDISGAHEISQGSAQKGNSTLGGLQLQVEQDETKLALLVQSYEDGIKKWGEKVLRLVRKHFPEEQQLSIVGENGAIEALTFSGADLTGKEVVDVIPGSSMPTLKAVQDQKIMEMYSAGMFNDPRTGAPDVRRVVRMLGESIATQYFDTTEQDENKALMENREYQQAFGNPANEAPLKEYVQALQGYQQQAQEMSMRGLDINQLGLTPPPIPVKLPIVRDFYDHEVHIAAHNRFRKSDEYDKLPPQFQLIIDNHVKEHEQMMMAPIIAQQQQEQASMQDQAKSQSEEADKGRQHLSDIKKMELDSKEKSEEMKANVAMATASMKGK